MEEDNDWYIYEADDMLSLSTPCYIGSRPEFDENEEEIFSEYAIENNMDYSIMPELVDRCCYQCFRSEKRCHRGRIAESAEPLFRCRYFYQVMNRAQSIVVCRILRSHQRTG